MKSRSAKSLLAVFLTSFFSFNFVTTANAITGTIPAPVIGTAQGFYAGNDYPALVGAFGSTWDLQPNEVLKISSVLIYEVSVAGVPCGPLVSTSKLVDSVVKRINDSTNKIDINQLANFTVPAESANKAICAITQVTTSSGVYESNPTYASVAPNPDATVSATPEAVAQAPSGTKPTFSGDPKTKVKQKIKIKAWNLNGSEFKSRKVTLYSCDKSDCSDKSAANSIVLEGLNFSDANTVTIPTAIPATAKYVVAYDTITYNGDKTVELATNVRSVSASTTVDDAAATDETTEEAVEEESEPLATAEAVTPTEEAVAVEEVVADETAEQRNPNALIAALVVVIAGLLGLILWLVRKKK